MNGNQTIPENWVWTTIGEAFEVILGQSPPSSTYNDEGIGLPFFQGSKEFGKTYPTINRWCSDPQKTSEKGDILISVRAPVGDINICPEAACIGRGVAAIRPMGGIQSLFVLYLLRSIKNKLIVQGTGTTFNAITGNKLRSTGIPLPPLSEQERMVSKIDELLSRLDAGVKSLSATKVKTEQYRNSLLQSTFRGDLTKRWRERNYFPQAQHSNTRPEWLPESWDWMNAANAFDIILGQSPPSSTYNEEGIGLPFFQGSKEFGSVFPDINRWCSDPIRIAEKGDVLLSIRAPVGDTNICPEKACIGRGLAAIRSNNSTQTLFILYLFRAMKNIFIRQGTGTTFSAITGARLRSTRVPIPPQAEQHVIIDTLDSHLSVVTTTLKEFEQSCRFAENLTSTIIHSAFQGQLVKQNSNDESAEVLLDRIRKEKHSVQKRLV